MAILKSKDFWAGNGTMLGTLAAGVLFASQMGWIYTADQTDNRILERLTDNNRNLYTREEMATVMKTVDARLAAVEEGIGKISAKLDRLQERSYTTYRYTPTLRE